MLAVVRTSLRPVPPVGLSLFQACFYPRVVYPRGALTGLQIAEHERNGLACLEGPGGSQAVLLLHEADPAVNVQGIILPFQDNGGVAGRDRKRSLCGEAEGRLDR